MIDKVKNFVIGKELNEVNEDENAEDKTGMLTKISNKFKSSIEVETDYKMFFIVIAIGLGFICLSLMFLPLILFSPQRFVSLFSIGSIITLSSFIFIYGTSGYLQMLFSYERRLFSSLYLLSIVVGLYFAFFHSYYLISMICAVIQLITLIIFTLSFIPGGSTGISFFTSMLRMPFDGLLMKIRGASYLPS